MNYKAEIKIKVDPENIYKCVLSELKEQERSKIQAKLKKDNKDCVLFEIEAKDAVAFRATLNTLLQLLTVYEKTKKVGKR